MKVWAKSSEFKENEFRKNIHAINARMSVHIKKNKKNRAKG